MLGGHNNKPHQDKERNQVYIGHEHEMNRATCRTRPSTQTELDEAVKQRTTSSQANRTLEGKT